MTVGVAGTGGGLRRLCRGGLDLADCLAAHHRRPRRAACAAAGVGFVELPVAYDGITVAVHPSNTWVDSLTRRGSPPALAPRGRRTPAAVVTAGGRSFPDRELHLFGAGVDSGTFDYFTGVITGAPRDSRGDYTSSEDDNTLVQGVASDPGRARVLRVRVLRGAPGVPARRADSRPRGRAGGPADARHDPIRRLPSAGAPGVRLRQRAVARSRTTSVASSSTTPRTSPTSRTTSATCRSTTVSRRRSAPVSRPRRTGSLFAADARHAGHDAGRSDWDWSSR